MRDECEHGSLRSKCEICERDDVISDWKRWHRELSDALGCEFLTRQVTLEKVKQLRTSLSEAEHERERDAERNRKLHKTIRETNREIQRLQRALPYCDECGHRVLRDHPCKHLRGTL